MNTGNIKQFIGVAAISLLTACGSPTPDAVLLKPGVSRDGKKEVVTYLLEMFFPELSQFPADSRLS